jgi:hypothetical protein
MALGTLKNKQFVVLRSLRRQLDPNRAPAGNNLTNETDLATNLPPVTPLQFNHNTTSANYFHHRR